MLGVDLRPDDGPVIFRRQNPHFSPNPKPSEVSPSQDGVCNDFYSHRRGMVGMVHRLDGLKTPKKIPTYPENYNIPKTTQSQAPVYFLKILPYWYFTGYLGCTGGDSQRIPVISISRKLRGVLCKLMTVMLNDMESLRQIIATENTTDFPPKGSAE